MPVDYQSLPAAELVATLDRVGRSPDPALIRCCLTQGEEIRVGLLARLQEGMGPTTDDDELRTLGEIHVAQLLIALREPAALPYLEQAFQDERRDYLLEWFSPSVPLLGPLAVPFLIRVAHDPGVHTPGRIAAVEVLSRIGEHHPGERERVLEAVRGMLPRLDDRGEIVLPPGEADPDELWSWAVWALADLHDTESKALVAALDQHQLLDGFLVGSGADLLAAFEVGAVFEPSSSAYDLLRDYETSFEEAHKAKSRPSANPELPRATVPSPTPPQVREAAPEQQPVVRTSPKVGPNDRCPCGGGKKFKRCCGK